jgi:hypothetical protein
MILKTLIPVIILFSIIGVALNFSKISKYFGFSLKEEDAVNEEYKIKQN